MSVHICSASTYLYNQGRSERGVDVGECFPRPEQNRICNDRKRESEQVPQLICNWEVKDEQCNWNCYGNQVLRIQISNGSNKKGSRVSVVLGKLLKWTPNTHFSHPEETHDRGGGVQIELCFVWRLTLPPNPTLVPGNQLSLTFEFDYIIAHV